MTKIAACMIIGDQFDNNELKRCFSSLRDAGISTLFIAFNGSVEENSVEIVRQVPLDLEVQISHFNWEENFAKARQQSFDMVPKSEYDWLMWIDSDDILVVEDNLKNLLDSVSESYAGIFMRYDYAIEPNTGQVVVEQWRERFLRAHLKWEWHHPVHEVCLAPPGAAFLRLDGAHIEHMRRSGDDRGARIRNRKIISRAMRENPDVARYVFYFAGETMAEAESNEDPEEKANLARAAILAFTKFKEMIPDVNDDYFVAQCRIAECFRMAGQWMEAIDADLETIAIYPSWPDGFIGAAKTCMELGDFTRMFGFADIACRMSKPKTSASIETMNTTFTPLFLRAIANEHLGNTAAAIEDYEAARKFWEPPGDKVSEKLAELREKLEEGTSEPKADIQRRETKGKKPEKSIAFLTTPIPEDWHPELMKQSGSGGAELCIMKLAPMFAADGWRVSIYGTPGENRGVYEEDGVEYWHSNDFDPSEKYKILVSSRTGKPFEIDLNAEKTYLWMHDVNIGPSLNDVKDKPDRIIGLTPWHVGHLSKLYGIDLDRLTVIPNGIDISRFPKENSDRIELQPKFIWSSSYDRGLETVLGMWPHIKARYNDATLDVYYGWNMYDRSIAQWNKINPAQADYLQAFKDKIVNQMIWLGVDGDSGIQEHGRVDQQTLANAMLESHIWPYTTQFMETFCITAIEMQAAGVIPITSNLAALTDNIAVKDLLVDGWPQNVSYQNQFLSVLDAVLAAPEDEILYARQEGRRLAESMTWENAYTKWNDLFADT